MTTTTTANYGETLHEATEQLRARISPDGYPEGEREKAICDALNNTWTDGITVAAWVDLATARL